MIAALAAAGALSCTPRPGLGAVTFTRGATVHVLDLATCADRTRRAPRPAPQLPLTSAGGRVRVTVAARRTGATGVQRIVVRDGRSVRTVYRLRERYGRNGIPAATPGPIMLLAVSPDGRWIAFAIDPMSSASIAADGLRVQIVSSQGGHARPLGPMLANDDYVAWCGGGLVFTGGFDRIATTHKRLLVARPPDWRARPLVAQRGRAFGSVVCAPGGSAVVVQAQRATGEDMSFDRSRWSLWRVGLDGAERRLTAPPPGFSDDSPRFSRNGRTLFFVRSRHGMGVLEALRGRRVVGPLARLGQNNGYYGHRAWPYSVRP